jgi:hypothetical protein
MSVLDITNCINRNTATETPAVKPATDAAHY